MGLIPEIIGKRGSLIEEALFPTMYGKKEVIPQAATASPAQGPAAQAAPTRRPGLRDILMSIFAGPNDPRLSDDQNRQAGSQALIQGGLATMAAASQPGANVGGALAQGAMFGQQAGAEQREALYGRTAAERVQNALNDPTFTAGLTPQQRSMIALLPPGEAVKVLTEIATRAPQPNTVVADGSQLYGPDGKLLATNDPKPQEIPPVMAALVQQAGHDPANFANLPQEVRDQVIEQYTKMTARPGTTVNVIPTPEKTQNQAGMSFYNSLDSSAQTSISTLNTLAGMESLLDAGMEAGALESATMPIRGIGVSLGILSEEQAANLSKQQLFRAFGNRMALSQKEGLTGPMSDKDIVFLKEQVPLLSNTVEGNRMLIEVMRRFEQRKIQMADLAEMYYSENGSAVGLRRYLSTWAEENPLTLSDIYESRRAPL